MTLDLDPRTTALVLIDLQEGIVSRPLVPHTGSAVVERSVLLARTLAPAGGLVVAVHVAFSADGADRLTQPVDSPTPVPAGGLPPNWAELVPDVAALEPGVIVTKRQWGAFYGTELDLQLRRRGINTIILAGIATNFGVESTAREAWQHGYAAVIAEDACASMTPEMHAFSIEKIFPRISRVRSTAEIAEALRAR